ncbi:polyprenol phosphomannose-dependent alpha 1,6 mannosyltransferase MptB [Gordonia sp. (in: high G+C Gram-positive bacteria)]|uniref:polyprenol phosphomannose-dependent alpha 1,6 mannosyltransferase MptB n=1 Tax=Gordonia sp. (in: high G+C Gram-positive bacteria) TaxID=84139 RepID=UPI002629CBBC|nr:polyprenol phosphomannose-dependent alpha 1,6 mannosyltransferase MptB [Gordonia sp. (in: high G+C Gram-positive bacteria)]
MSARLRGLLSHPDALLGFVGAVLFAVGTYGVADIPRNDTTLQNLGLAPITYGSGKALAWIAFWTGVTLMVIAWIRIGRAVLAGTSDLDVRGTRWTVCAWALPMLFAVPVFSRDVYAYLGQAWVLAQGYNPYLDGPAHAPGPIVDSMAQIWAPTTSPYTPLFMLIARGVVAVTGQNVIAGVFVMRLVLLIGLALSLWALPALAERFGASPRLALWLVLLNPMLLAHLVAGPHLELLMMGFLAAGVAVVVGAGSTSTEPGMNSASGPDDIRGRPVYGLLLLGVAASIKITAAVAIPFVVWMWLDQLRRQRAARGDPSMPVERRRDQVRRVVGVFAATALIPAAVFGVFTLTLGLGLGWLNGLSWASRIINPFTIPTLAGHLVTYVAAPFHVWNLQQVLPVTRAIGEVVLAVLLVWFWWRSRTDTRAAVAGAAWAMLAVLLLEPSTLPWYYVWTLVLAVAFDLPLWVRQVVVGVSVFFLITFQPDDSITFYKPIPSLVALLLAVLAAVSLDRRDPLRLRRLRDWAFAIPPKHD